MSLKWSWPNRKSQSSATTRGPPCFYILTTHSLSAGLPRQAQSQQCTDVVWVLCTKGQSAKQQQIYTLSSHCLHYIHIYCSDTVLTTHSPHLTFYYILLISLLINILLMLSQICMSKSSPMNCTRTTMDLFLYSPDSAQAERGNNSGVKMWPLRPSCHTSVTGTNECLYISQYGRNNEFYFLHWLVLVSMYDH